MTRADFAAFWPSFKAMIQAQQSYTFEPDMSLEQSYQLWCEQPLQSYVYEQDGKILGSYYLKANAKGPGKHICNCGYMVSEAARGQGIARQMCEHSQLEAKKHGFQAMQFNSVVSSNHTAVNLWKKLGFEIIGTLPQGYQHPQHGLVDCYIMYKPLSAA